MAIGTPGPGWTLPPAKNSPFSFDSAPGRVKLLGKGNRPKDRPEVTVNKTPRLPPGAIARDLPQRLLSSARLSPLRHHRYHIGGDKHHEVESLQPLSLLDRLSVNNL